MSPVKSVMRIVIISKVAISNVIKSIVVVWKEGKKEKEGIL